MSVPAQGGTGLRTGTAAGRWVLTAAVLGSGVAFLDGSVVNAALPAISGDFAVGLSSLQWVLTAYLLTLGSFLVLGGSLGDLFGRRRVFLLGLGGFAVASAICGLAPSVGFLIAARALQGVAAAMLVPGSLAIISASFHPDDRGSAIGAWSGLAGISTALGPFLGGWLIDSVSWRWVFGINVPLVVIAVLITMRHVPESFDTDAIRHVDWAGATALAVGLGWRGARADRRTRARVDRRDGRPRDTGGGVARVVRRDRVAVLASDGAARRVPVAAVLRREPRDVRGLRRARRGDVPARRAPPAGPRLLGAGGGRGALADHRPDGVVLGPGRCARPADRAAVAHDDRPDGRRRRARAAHPGRARRDLCGGGPARA